MAGGGYRTGRPWGIVDVAVLAVLARFCYTMTDAAYLLRTTKNEVSGAARRNHITFKGEPL